MKIFFLIAVLLSPFSFPQSINPALRSYQDLHSPRNIKKFADYLFCSGDYLRSIDEYKKYIEIFPDDTVAFKIGLALSRMKKYNEAADYFSRHKKNSSFAYESEIELDNALLRSGEYDSLRRRYSGGTKSIELERMNYLSYFFTNNPLAPEEDFISSFPEESRNKIKSFFEWKNDPPLKNELTAVILSSLIPGAGKFYIEEYGDGIAAFAAAVLFGFLSYDNFRADHKFRGWLFAGISAFFYAGNVYGSAAGVQIYNAKLFIDFRNSLNLYLDSQNYFMPEYNLCK